MIDLGPQVSAQLPFASPVFGGLALMVIVALPLTLLAWMAWRGEAGTSRMALVTGGLLMGWIIVQLAFIRDFSWFHPTYFKFGAALVIMGRRQG